MKLNLLPTYVSKEKSARAAWVLAVMIALVSIVAAVFMKIKSTADLTAAKEEATRFKTQHEQALAASKEADTIMASAQQIIVNIDLAKAMMAHNSAYPKLYDEVRAYLPSFFRVTSMNATPSGADNCTVTIQGVIRTYQQYADVMLALLRIPGAAGVTRSGYQTNDPYIPSLREGDQTGRPILPGQQNVPDDPMQRLNALMAQAPRDGFTGEGGFGTDTRAAKGPMPEWSLITVAVVLPRNIQTPSPRATLAAVRGSGAPPMITTPASSTTPAATTTTPGARTTGNAGANMPRPGSGSLGPPGMGVPKGKK